MIYGVDEEMEARRICAHYKGVSPEHMTDVDSRHVAYLKGIIEGGSTEHSRNYVWKKFAFISKSMIKALVRECDGVFNG